MKKLLLITAALLSLSATAANARTSFSIGINQPVYYQPVPVYYQPAPIYYQPAPVYYQPAPAYYGPPAYYPTYYNGRDRHRNYDWRYWHRQDEWRRAEWEHDHRGAPPYHGTPYYR
jgi:hypothetical protein